MRIAVQAPPGDETPEFLGAAKRFVERHASVVYLPHLAGDRDIARALAAAGGSAPIEGTPFEAVVDAAALNQHADVLVCFAGRPDVAPLAPPAAFSGLKIFHVMDYVFQAGAAHRALVDGGVDVVMGYAFHDRYDPFFRAAYPSFADRVLPVPFGFASRFAPHRPFRDRIAKVIGLGSINPVDDPLAPPGELDEYIRFYAGHRWTHRWRRALLEHADELSAILDHEFPMWPDTKNPAYDAVERLNAYMLYANDEGLLSFPPARTYEGVAAGSVLVCSDHPAYRDLGFVDGDTCVTHGRDDVDGFRSTVEGWLRDLDGLEAIAIAGSAHAHERFTHEAVADRLAAAINGLLRGDDVESCAAITLGVAPIAQEDNPAGGAAGVTAIRVRTTPTDTVRQPTIAVITPSTDRNDSPLWPGLPNEASRKWDYYHACLDRCCDGDYFDIANWRDVAGFDTVFVHETLYTRLVDGTVPALEHLARHNGRVTWVELHERSTFSGAVVSDGFFDCVDLVLKHQLVDFDFLRAALRNHGEGLAPYMLFGHPTFEAYVRDLRCFGGLTRPADLSRHLEVDLGELYGSRIRPLMYPFSSEVLADGWPAYHPNPAPDIEIGAATRARANHFHRNQLVAALRRAGVEVRDDVPYRELIARSRAFLGLGHIHSSLRTFDALAHETVLVHYGPGPYVVWDEFLPYQSYVPFGDVSTMFSRGGSTPEWGAIDGACRRLAADLTDPTVVERVLTGQRALFDLVTDPAWIVGKLGVDVAMAADHADDAAPARAS